MNVSTIFILFQEQPLTGHSVASVQRHKTQKTKKTGLLVKQVYTGMSKQCPNRILSSIMNGINVSVNNQALALVYDDSIVCNKDN